MVVVMPADRSFVAGLPVPEVPRVREAALVKQLHRPVHRGHRDARIVLTHLRPELLHREVAADGEEGVDDQAPLPRALQAVLGHVATEKLRSGVDMTHGYRCLHASTAPGTSGDPRSTPVNRTRDACAWPRTVGSG